MSREKKRFKRREGGKGGIWLEEKKFAEGRKLKGEKKEK